MSRALHVTKQLPRIPWLMSRTTTAVAQRARICSHGHSLTTPKARSLSSSTVQRSSQPHQHFQATSVAPVKPTFGKLLIANRGEIACRIIKTARRMNIRTVAVFSDLDANAPHVQMADEAICIGDAQSYLSIPRMIQAAKQSGAQAVHPGYGFLSENPSFVTALREEGLTFVGPSSEAIAAMGDKIQSKLIAQASGVSCIPGFSGQVATTADAIKAAHEIGYPVMIKASAGGGGKGMRIAWNDQELVEGFKLAKQESKSAFGDDRMLLEKYIDQPRHIEIQILGDNHGNVVYLPPRECSIQRRNQKVIEESPSVHIDPDTWHKMGAQAVALARHVGYSSAGTVEFLVDHERNFYFLEMNTRLQVEHPVTEYVTGIDLVEQMLYAASGHPLSLRQDEITCRGWAIESRVYAEDPTRYLPSVGRLLTYREPSSTGNIRCDSGIKEGSDIPVEYDPLLCKLTTYGNTRAESIDTMVRALDEYVIKGVTHNLPLLRSVVNHPRFRQGRAITTNFLSEEYPNGYQSARLSAPELHQLAAANAAMWSKMEASVSHPPATPRNIWVQLTNEQVGLMEEVRLSVRMTGKNTCEVSSPIFEKLTVSTQWPLDDLLAHASIDETKQDLVVQYLDKMPFGFRIQYRGDKFNVAVLNDRQRELSKYMKPKAKEEESKLVTSPMPGRVISVAVQKGDKVLAGAEVAVVEAMKMQNVLRTARVGTVKSVHVEQGNAVQAGQVLIEFEDDNDTSSTP